MLIRCPECREQISDQATACPRCGRPISDQDRESARSAAATAAKTSKGLKLGVVAFAVVIGVFTLLMALRARSRPPQPGPAELVAGWPIGAQATRKRELGVEAWTRFVATDPRTRGMVRRIEVPQGSKWSILAFVDVRPDSVFARTAARRPHAERVEETAKLLSVSLWNHCRDGDLNHVLVLVSADKRYIGTACAGRGTDDLGERLCSKWRPEGEW